MKVLFAVIGWGFGLLFALLAISMFLTNNWLAPILLTIGALLLLPPVAMLLQQWSGVRIPGWGRGLIAVTLLVVSLASLMSGEATAVYLTPEAEHMAIYDAKLAIWPAPTRARWSTLPMAPVHVIVSGPEDGPPAQLLNASGMSGRS